jgi:hypothetical protein
MNLPDVGSCLMMVTFLVCCHVVMVTRRECYFDMNAVVAALTNTSIVATRDNGDDSSSWMA